MTEYQRNGLKIVVPRDLVLIPTQMMAGRRRVYKLASPFRIWIRSDGVHENHEIPAGFTTDLATIPLVAQMFVGGRDNPGVAEAAVWHDWACTSHLPRSYANGKLFYLLLAFGVNYWKALAFYAAVSVFGYGSLLSRAWQRVLLWLNLGT